MNKFILMHEDDNCATSLQDIRTGEVVEIGNLKITITQDIDMGHKIALTDINKGDFIKKYGEIIGIATEDINQGEWIHTHNITSHYLKEVVDA